MEKPQIELEIQRDKDGAPIRIEYCNNVNEKGELASECAEILDAINPIFNMDSTFIDMYPEEEEEGD